MLKFIIKGNFRNAENFFYGVKKTLPRKLLIIFEKYGQQGVEALKKYTPRDTGKTAQAWDFIITQRGIIWTNERNIKGITPLAILLQYGHGTRQGTYIQGIDYINPALKPIFIDFANEIQKEVEAL